MSVAIPLGQSRHAQVAIANCFHLVHIMLPNDPVKHRVHVVHQIHHLQWFQSSRDGSEADHIREEHRHALKVFGLYGLAQFEAVRDLPSEILDLNK